MHTTGSNAEKRILQLKAQLRRLALASEDINFSLDGIRKFISSPDDPLNEMKARGIKEHLFYSTIVSYGKMFVSSRGNKLGPIKIKSFDILKTPEWREVHEQLLSLRNEAIAHNDGHSSYAQLGWSIKHGIHFPQRYRKTYWNKDEALKVLFLMENIEKEILRDIYSLISQLKPPPGTSIPL